MDKSIEIDSVEEAEEIVPKTTGTVFTTTTATTDKPPTLPMDVNESAEPNEEYKTIDIDAVNRKDEPDGNKNVDSFVIEKITVYETKHAIYIVGNNNSKDCFRVAKIDRTAKRELVICDEKRVLSLKEFTLLRKNAELDKKTITHAFGIVGFVNFLEGYYLIVITKRRCVAMIGVHLIYKIEDTKIIPVSNDKSASPDEQKYMKIFNNVDLKSNFYFSYSYDLSNTLQYNLTPIYTPKVDPMTEAGFGFRHTLWDVSEKLITQAKAVPLSSNDEHEVFFKPNAKFIWNKFLIQPMVEVDMHNDFFLYLVHGFVSQAMLPISGRNLVITLIARRSTRYAGTRFLKRGANCDGEAANEVETEQIVHDANISSFRSGLFTSFVQLRGSVPTYWSQSIARVGSKPPIVVDIKDPFYEAAGMHFNKLLYHYGSPVIVLNLVKRKEKKPHECILYNEFDSAIEYLNQFLPKQHQLLFVGFDMARCNKAKDDSVLHRLTHIADLAVKKNGFFQNRPMAINQATGWPRRSAPKYRSDPTESIFQMGVTRVNCVDCLDRTNTAQFAIGRVALAFQLYSMGIIYKPELELDSDIVSLLEELYEDHGDTIAMQYGGSQLVHRIQTYRKNAPLTSQSKDIMQSLSRYYANAFSDSDKQNAINLFLGVYRPLEEFTPIWAMLSDYALHHNFLRLSEKLPGKMSHGYRKHNHTKFWSDEVAICLPRAAKEFYKDQNYHELSCPASFVKRIPFYDWFYDINRLQENVHFDVLYMFNIKKHKAYGDDGVLKKASNFRSANRQSLAGIPLNTANLGKEDTDNSDLSDIEEDNIIIRFESDHVIELGAAQEAYDQLNSNNEASLMSLSTFEELTSTGPSSLENDSNPAVSFLNKDKNVYRNYEESFESMRSTFLPDANTPEVNKKNLLSPSISTRYVPIYEEYIWYEVRSHNFLRGYNDYLQKRDLQDKYCLDELPPTPLLWDDNAFDRAPATQPVSEEIDDLCRVYGKYFPDYSTSQDIEKKMWPRMKCKDNDKGCPEDNLSWEFVEKDVEGSTDSIARENTLKVYHNYLGKSDQILSNMINKLKDKKEVRAYCDGDSTKKYFNYIKLF